jgi:uncharacterized protein (TIGR03066 family)
MIATTMLFVALAVTVQDGGRAVDPSKLVGVWEVIKGTQPPAGSTLEFTGDGKFTSNLKGVDITFAGTYKLNGDQLTLDPPGVAMTVKELTASKLVVGGSGNDIEYQRKTTGARPRSGMTTGGFSFGAQTKGGQRTSGFTLGAQPKAAGKWETVTSKEDGFTVEMPGQPNGSESGSGGGFDVHGISYQMRGMELIVTAIHGPTEIPKAEEAKALESIRNKAVRKYGKNLIVVSEKQVRSGDIEGQEFELSIDRLGAGTMNVRGRTFINGKRAYVLMAIPSASGQTLSPDAQKFLESFSIGDRSAATTAKADPPMTRSGVPKGAPRKLAPNPVKAWGMEVDPDGDVVVRRSGQSLTMDIPGTPHLLAPERDKMNAPRVVASARGDFVVTVQVEGKFKPRRESTVKGLAVRQAGGLILWKDSKNYLVFQHRASIDDGKIINQAVLEELVNGSKGATHRQPSPEGAVFLRVERNGGRIAASFSVDGKDWKELKPVDTMWAEGEVQVGVVGVNTSAAPHSVTFEGYSLKPK